MTPAPRLPAVLSAVPPAAGQDTLHVALKPAPGPVSDLAGAFSDFLARQRATEVHFLEQIEAQGVMYQQYLRKALAGVQAVTEIATGFRPGTEPTRPGSATHGTPVAARRQATTAAQDVVLDPTVDTWLVDHSPPYTVPVVPMVAVVDYLAAAAQAERPDRVVVAVSDVQLRRWLTTRDGTVRLRTRVTWQSETEAEVSLEIWRSASRQDLSRYDVAATGRVRVASGYPSQPAAWPRLAETTTTLDPFETGWLFHGPTFRVLQHLALSPAGGSAILDASQAPARGLLNFTLLDGIFQALPHPELPHLLGKPSGTDPMFPARFDALTVYGPAPTAGPVRCETRVQGPSEDGRFLTFQAQLIVDDHLWAEATVTMAAFPAGPLGRVDRMAMRRFLQDRIPEPGLRFSQTTDGVTTLDLKTVRAGNWLDGTLQRAFDVPDRIPLLQAIAAKEHVAALAGCHPSHVQLDGDEASVISQPLRHWHLQIDGTTDQVRVRDRQPADFDLSPIVSSWRNQFGWGPWPGEDLYLALVRRWVSSIRYADPADWAAGYGKPALFLANHQTGVESLLFKILSTGLRGTPCFVVAKAEHRTSWLRTLLDLTYSYPGVEDPGLLAFFERGNPDAMMALLDEMQRATMERGCSVLVHIEGTRSRSCREPVKILSSAFLELALSTGMPIIPVGFTGGLPAEPLETKTEFPVGYGRQSITFGRSLNLDDLQQLPNKERKTAVLDAINALLRDDLEPAPPEPAFAARLGARLARGGDEVPLTILETLASDPALGPHAAQLLAVAEGQPEASAPGAIGEWQRAFAGWLAGHGG